MTIEYVGRGIFLFTGEEAHFDSLVESGRYSYAPAHEVPYDIQLEVKARLDARGIKGSSTAKSTGQNERGQNCWAPNKPCGKTCRVNCKSTSTGGGAGGSKATKGAAGGGITAEDVSKAKAKKAAAASPNARFLTKEEGEAAAKMHEKIAASAGFQKPSSASAKNQRTVGTKQGPGVRLPMGDQKARIFQEGEQIGDEAIHIKGSKKRGTTRDRVAAVGRAGKKAARAAMWGAGGEDAPAATTATPAKTRKPKARKTAPAPASQSGPIPEAKYGKKISDKQYAAGEKAFIARLRASKDDQDIYDADKMEAFPPGERRKAFGHRVENHILDGRRRKAEKKAIPEILAHQNVSPEEHQAGIDRAAGEFAKVRQSNAEMVANMSPEQKASRFGYKGARYAAEMKQKAAAASAPATSTATPAAKKAKKSATPKVKDLGNKALAAAEEAGIGRQDFDKMVVAHMRKYDMGNPRNWTAAERRAQFGPEVLAAYQEQQGGGSAPKAKKAAAPKAKKSSSKKTPKGWASREDYLEAQMLKVGDKDLANVVGRDSFNVDSYRHPMPYYAATGLPSLVDPFHAFR